MIERIRIDWWICTGYNEGGEVIAMKKYTISYLVYAI